VWGTFNQPNTLHPVDYWPQKSTNLYRIRLLQVTGIFFHTHDGAVSEGQLTKACRLLHGRVNCTRTPVTVVLSAPIVLLELP
jgi:hypothetical protein